MRAVIDVPLATLTLSTVRPAPSTFTVAPGTKLVPASVTVGVGGMMVNDSVAVVPPAFVTVIVRAPSAAAASIARVAVRVVLLVTDNEPTVTPVPLTETLVAPLTKLLPEIVTGTD